MKNPIEYTKIHCLTCRGILSDVLYRYTTSLFFEDQRYPIKSVLNFCEGCGMIFNNPRLTEQTLEWVYSTWYGADSALYGSEELKRVNTARTKFITKHAVFFHTAIDIGCGSGSLLSHLKQQGKMVYGIEPSADLCRLAMATYGIDLFEGLLDQSFTEKHENVYDLVTFTEVLEHVYNPVEFLSLAMRISNKFVYFDVPNTLKPRYWNVADFYSYEHVTHFTKYSIKRLAESLGFEVVAIEEDPDDPILKVLLKKGGLTIRCSQIYEISEVHDSFKYYIKKRKEFLESIKKKLCGESAVVLYGAGRHSIQLIENGLLDGVVIKNVIDSNLKKHGTKFIRYRIESPNILANCSYPVLISTFESQEDISQYLSKKFPHVRQIKLYT